MVLLYLCAFTAFGKVTFSALCHRKLPYRRTPVWELRWCGRVQPGSLSCQSRRLSRPQKGACFSFPSRKLEHGKGDSKPRTRFQSQLCCSLAVAVKSHVWSALGSREVIRDGSQGDLATTGEIYSVLEPRTVTYTLVIPVSGRLRQNYPEVWGQSHYTVSWSSAWAMV